MAAVVLPLLLLLAWMFFGQLERELREARNDARRVAKMTAARIGAQHEAATELLGRMARRPAVREFDGATCDSLFAIVASFPEWTDLLFYDTRGALACSALPSREDEAVARQLRPRIATELARGMIPARRPVVRFMEGRWFTVLSEPVVGGNGVARGTLVLVQSLDLDGSALISNTVITILDRDARVIARTAGAPAVLGQDAGTSEVAKIALREREGWTEATGVDGISRQYGFTFLPATGWTILAGERTAEVMRELRAMALTGLGGGAAIILLITVVALVISRGIERLSTEFTALVAHRSESERNLKALSERVLFVQEQERMRVARELHDDLGQSLTALKMDVIGLLEKSRHSPDAAPMVERILRTIDSTVTAVQRISSELRPSLLDDLGLFAAIESEARLFEERTGIECDLSLPDELPGVDGATTVAVYRMIQEAMTNVARHSNASRVEIRVRRRAAELLLEIRDDGRGIGSDEAADRSALGLAGIRERAAILGGTALIEGVPDRGTIVSIRIPLPPQENEA